MGPSPQTGACVRVADGPACSANRTQGRTDGVGGCVHFGQTRLATFRQASRTRSAAAVALRVGFASLRTDAGVDHIGPHTLNVADCGAMLEVMARLRPP